MCLGSIKLIFNLDMIVKFLLSFKFNIISCSLFVIKRVLCLEIFCIRGNINFIFNKIFMNIVNCKS